MSDPYEHEVVREERRDPAIHPDEPATATHVSTSSYSVVRPGYNYRAVKVVWFVVSVVVALLTIRFALKLLAGGAGPQARPRFRAVVTTRYPGVDDAAARSSSCQTSRM